MFSFVRTSNNIEFWLGIKPNATPVYNVRLACITAPMLSEPMSNQFYSLTSSGLPSHNASYNGITLSDDIFVQSWPCSANNPINGSFDGYLFVNYTPTLGAPSPNGNPWNQDEFYVVVNVILPLNSSS